MIDLCSLADLTIDHGLINGWKMEKKAVLLGVTTGIHHLTTK